MKCFTWSIKDKDFTVPGYQYNEEFKQWKFPIHNSKSHANTLKENIKTEDIFYKYVVYYKFNGITRNVNLEIPIRYYKYQCRENMIRNGVWGIFSLKYFLNQDKESIYVLVSLVLFETPHQYHSYGI